MCRKAQAHPIVCFAKKLQLRSSVSCFRLADAQSDCRDAQSDWQCLKLVFFVNLHASSYEAVQVLKDGDCGVLELVSAL